MNRYACGAVGVTSLIAIAVAGAGPSLKADGQEPQKVVYRSGSDVPDPAKVGKPEVAIQRARELIALLRPRDWKIDKGFPLDKLTIDDQRYAEFPNDRKQRTSFGVPRPVPPYEEVAVICDTYVRKNIIAHQDGSSRQAPSGFFIVGFKDGRVEKIPVDKVRIKEYAMAGASTRRVGLVFPGTREYTPSLPKFH